MKYNLNIFLVQNLPEIIDFSAKHSLQFVARTKGGVHGAIFHNRVHLVEFLECTVENYLESYLLHLPLSVYITGSEAVACCDEMGILSIDEIRSIVSGTPEVGNMFQNHASEKHTDLYSSIIAFDLLMNILSQDEMHLATKRNEVRSYFRPLQGGLYQRYKEFVAD